MAAGDAQMLKRPKAGEAQGAAAAVPAGNGHAAGDSAAPGPSSVPTFLQAGQVSDCVCSLNTHNEPCRAIVMAVTCQRVEQHRVLCPATVIL